MVDVVASWRSILAFAAIGCLSAFLCVMLFAYLSTLVPNTRIAEVLMAADGAGQLDPWHNIADDMFTECAIMDMALVRSQPPQDLAGSKFAMPASHPCDGLRLHLAGLQDHTVPETRYFYGSRYLFTLFSALMGVETMRNIMASLSIAAPLALLSAFLSTGRWQTMVPIVVLMLIGFDLSNLGGNLAHAPGLIFPVLGLAGIVSLRRYFAPFARRVCAYSALAVVTIYLDILSGPLPFILALTLVVNHLAFSVDRPQRLREMVLVGAVFLLSAIAALGMKMGISALVFARNPLIEFNQAIALRLSSMGDDGGAITRGDEFGRLWELRGVPFFGSAAVATLFYGLGAISWIWAATASVIRRSGREVAVLAASASCIIAWYAVFPNHTYVHAGFMGRIGGLVPALGFSALISAGSRIAPLSALAAVGLALVAQATLLRVELVRLEPRYDLKIDAASCSNSPVLVPDGQPDRIVEATFRSGFFPDYLISVTLSRSAPGGIVSSLPGSFPLAVLDANGHLLSRPDRSFSAVILGETHLLLAFCEDHASAPTSGYTLHATTIFGDLTAPEAKLFNGSRDRAQQQHDAPVD